MTTNSDGGFEDTKQKSSFIGKLAIFVSLILGIVTLGCGFYVMSCAGRFNVLHGRGLAIIATLIAILFWSFVMYVRFYLKRNNLIVDTRTEDKKQKMSASWQKLKDLRKNQPIRFYLSMVILGGAFVWVLISPPYLALLLINRDYSPGKLLGEKNKVLDKHVWYHRSGPTEYNLKVAVTLDQTFSNKENFAYEVSVEENLYQSFSKGDCAYIIINEGGLGYPWVSSVEKCP